MVRIPVVLSIIFIALFSIDLYSQHGKNAAQLQVDSLRALLKKTQDQDERAKFYGLICFAYAGPVGRLDLARHYADSIRIIANDLKDESKIASFHFYRGVIARHEGNLTDAPDHLQHHAAFYKSAGDSAEVAKSLFQIGVVNNVLGNYEKSLSAYYRILDIHEKNGYYHGVGFTLNSIGVILKRMKRYEDALVVYRKALSCLDSLGTHSNIMADKANVLMNLGNVFSTTQQYAQAGEYYKQSLTVSRELGMKGLIASNLSNIGNLMARTNLLDSALAYHRQSLTIHEQLGNKAKIALVMSQVGETYFAMKKIAIAQAYFMRALGIAKEIRDKPLVRDLSNMLSRLFAAQRDYQNAYTYQQLFTSMNDSILNEETARQISELQTKYETGEKDKQILLLAREKAIQTIETGRQQAWKKTLIGILVLVSSLTILLLYIFRQRLRNQKVVASKDAEIREIKFKKQLGELEMKALRAQINPHFLFNSMNSINRMILNSEIESASVYLTKFSKLIRLILENSETPTVSLESELTMLESYIQLEELRLKERINYIISVSHQVEAESTYIPPMVLQPFVENAIWHGLMHKEKGEKGRIEIEVRETENGLLCSIQDNGVGRAKAQVLREQSVLKRKSMGMRITEERLRLMSRGPLNELIRVVDLRNSLDQAIGTRVEVNIPIP